METEDRNVFIHTRTTMFRNEGRSPLAVGWERETLVNLSTSMMVVSLKESVK